MRISFTKYQGAGNDFILIDNRDALFPAHDSRLIARLCHRHRGIGADGLLLLECSQLADYKMRIFNADGSEPAMCGNGIRCLVLFLQKLDLSNKVSIEVAGNIFPCSREGNRVTVQFKTPQISHWPIAIDSCSIYVLNTGVPHAVTFVDSLSDLSVLSLGKQIRWHQAFAPEGVNVNFVQVLSDNSLAVRTYERGVEAETFACGTGAAAAAWTARRLYSLKSPLTVHTRSTDKAATFENNLSFVISPIEEDIEMTGPAQEIFSGIIYT